jgi:hypothetical protein
LHSVDDKGILASSQPSFSVAVNSSPTESLQEAEGTPEDIFLEPVDPQFLCVHCKKVLRGPMQSGCGCRWCYGCLQRERMQQGDHLQCSNCKEHFYKQEVARDNFARKWLEKLIVYCSNRSRGCREQMPFGSLDSHLQEDCPYELIHCMLRAKGCQARIQRNHLVQHMEKECLYRRQRCQFCGDDIALSDIELHEKDCRNMMSECPNQCGVSVHKDKIDEHVNSVCKKQVVPCLFANYGCPYKEFREVKQMDVHMSDQQIFHLECITVHIKAMDKELEGLCEMKTRMENKLAVTVKEAHAMAAASVSIEPEPADSMSQLPAKNKRQIRDLQVCEAVPFCL